MPEIMYACTIAVFKVIRYMSIIYTTKYVHKLATYNAAIIIVLPDQYGTIILKFVCV